MYVYMYLCTLLERKNYKLRSSEKRYIMVKVTLLAVITIWFFSNKMHTL